MGELASALDALAAEELHGLPAAGLLDRTAGLVAARNPHPAASLTDFLRRRTRSATVPSR